MLREVYFYLKKYKFVSFCTYLQITLSLMIFGAFLFFLSYLDIENNLIKEKYQDKSLFQLRHQYLGEKEDEFLEESESLHKVKEFYNLINSSTKFKVLNASQLPIYTNINTDETFFDGYEDGYEQTSFKYNDIIFYGLKSFQVNMNSYRFFDLETQSGRGFKEQDFNLESNENFIPIILGDSYKDMMDINDEIKIDYFGRIYTAKVIGFLKPNSSILSYNYVDTNLDKYILTPWVNLENPLDNKEYDFQLKNYMLRIASFVITEDDTEIISSMREEFEHISQKTGFSEYLFLGENTYMSDYKNIMLIIKENSALIIFVLSIICILNLIIIVLTNCIQSNQRKHYYITCYSLGKTKSKIFLQQWLELMIIFIMSYVTNRIIMSNIFVLIDYRINILLLIFIFIASLITASISYFKNIQKSIDLNLNSSSNVEELI